jgi:hypothetical protein
MYRAAEGIARKDNRRACYTRNCVTEIGMRKAASGNGISSESDFQSVPNEL